MDSILLVDTSYPINTRNVRFLASFRNNFKDVHCVTWNRDTRIVATKDEWMAIYSKKSEYGKPILKMMNLLGYYCFLFKYNRCNHPRILVASHWDTLVLCALLKSRNQILIYENLDIPTSSYRIVRVILKCIENLALLRTDVITFASRFYLDLYSSFKGEKFVIENKLLTKVENKVVSRDVLCTKKLRISYIGNIRYLDILCNLIDAVGGEEDIDLQIHGDGPDFKNILERSQSYNNVHLTGRYDYSNISLLYEKSDVVWAAYPSEDYNVKYAISNKFHESIAYGVPCIFSDNTKLSEYVEIHNLGYIVNPYNVSDIKSLLLELFKDKESYMKKCKSLVLLKSQEKDWEDELKPFIRYLSSIMRT